ncbi:hypothetical protein N0V88_005129 [Collariella sp. IMI 366227]|nr:hypothetical protein N0V88_005129 [Collariella sp. IMI 366227]
MLKTYPTTFLLPKRLSLASLLNKRRDPAQRDTQNNALAQTSSLSSATDASLAHQHREDPRQPALLVSHRMATPQADGASRPQRSFLNFFPLGYKEAAQQWVSLHRSPPETPPQSDPFGQRVWRSSMVQLSGKNRALNELSIERIGEQVDDTLVMVHGYGAGLGFFYKNFEPLSRAQGWRLYALDMLGMGNSSRPPFKVHAKDPKEKIAEAESWFIDALEEWRKVRNIEKFTLLGHSLGGYLAVSYALKYPGRLNKLILASPVGIPEDPWAVNAALPEPENSTLANEFTQDQESIHPPTRRPPPPPLHRHHPPKRPIPGWLVWLWDANVSPFSIVRLSGPLGPRFVSGWTSRRFNHLPTDEKDALHTYAYTIFTQRGSGEYVLPYVLAPGAYARSPVINRIQDVGRQTVQPATETTPAVRETGLPIVFMYGENDWMDVAGGYAAEEKIRQRVVARALLEGSEEERKRENGSAKVVVVRKAGHHLYLDNPEEFNEVVRKEMEDTREKGKRERERATVKV